MPACFNLTKKGATEPTPLATIDDELCAHFGVKPHPERWYMGWYYSVGLGLALGRSWQDIREIVPSLTRVVDYLEANYVPHSWAGR